MNKKIDVTKLENFEKTAIFQDEQAQKLRNGGNVKKAMFMTMFATECYAKFNTLSTHHFSTTPWKLSNDFKSNVVRVW